MAHSNSIYPIYITCCLGLFLSTLDTGIINLALNSLSINFNVSLEYIGFSVTLYLLFLIVFLIPSGWFGDFFGQKIALIMGFSLFGLTSLLAGISESANQLIISRCGQGIGAALLQANCLGLAGLQSTKQKLRLNSCIMLSISLGPILGPSFGGVILKLCGWQLLFLINVPLCIFGSLFSLKITKTTNAQKNRVFDLKGMMRFKLLLNPPVRYLFIGSFVFGLTAGVVFTVSPLLFIGESSYTIDYIGLICTASPIGVVLSVFIKKLIGTNYNKIILCYALPFMLLAFVLLFFVSFNISVFEYVIAALCYGVGGGLFQSALIQIATNQQKDKQSTIGGLLRLFQNGGIIVGAAYSLAVLDVKVASLCGIPAYSKLWGIMFIALVIMFVYSYKSSFGKNAARY
ncbi:MFS transporter [Orbaceae bacterium ac157xtp]